MSIEKNKAVISRFYELVNQRKLDEQFELFAPEYIFHSSLGDVTVEQLKPVEATVAAAFSDSFAKIDSILAEGDMVAWQVHMETKHTGEFLRKAATRKEINMTKNYIARIVDGKIAEQWEPIEFQSVFQQLGIEFPLRQQK